MTLALPLMFGVFPFFGGYQLVGEWNGRRNSSGCQWRAPSAERGNHASFCRLVTRFPRAPAVSNMEWRGSVSLVWRGACGCDRLTRSPVFRLDLNAWTYGLGWSPNSDRIGSFVSDMDGGVLSAMAWLHQRSLGSDLKTKLGETGKNEIHG
jgi:hypothetical protein